MLSPLRYPGGKADFVDTFEHIVTKTGHAGLPIVEPYAGSASISLGLLERGVVRSAEIIERDPLIYAFWTCVFQDTERFIERFDDLVVSLSTWKKLRPLLEVDKPAKRNLLDLAVAGLFFNRANFSGILHGGPIGGMSQDSEYKVDCRTNKHELYSRIAVIADLAAQVTVKFGDGLDQIKKERRKNILYYVDPPYFVMGTDLYRFHFSHRDHKNLAAVLNGAKFPWVLSYDNHYVIEVLYEDCQVRKHKFLYSAKRSKRDSELVIANFDLPKELLASPSTTAIERKRPKKK